MRKIEKQSRVSRVVRAARVVPVSQVSRVVRVSQVFRTVSRVLWVSRIQEGVMTITHVRMTRWAHCQCQVAFFYLTSTIPPTPILKVEKKTL